MGKFSVFCLHFCGNSDVERKARRSYTRKGSMIDNKSPSRVSNKNNSKNNNSQNESHFHKVWVDSDVAALPMRNDSKNKNIVKMTVGKKQGGKEQDKHGNMNDDLASSVNEKDREEMKAIREELLDLRRKLAENDELLKIAEMSKGQTTSVESQVVQLKNCASGKSSPMKTTQLQHNGAKIKQSDKQAYLEYLQWEATTSHEKVEKLQEELDSMQFQISSFVFLFEELSKEKPIPNVEDYDIKPSYLDRLPDLDEMDEREMQTMEEARLAYVAAVAVAKEKQDEESLGVAARARLHLQSFVFKSDI